MLYKTLKKLVDKGMTDELREKIDTFYALGRLSEAEYHSLIG